MNYEQRYKNALEKIREGLQPLQDGTKISGVTRAFLEEVFPELKESEEERIRKGLIKAVSGTMKGNTLFGTNVTREEAIAWLEKQGEHDETSIAIKNPEAYRIGFADGEAHAKEEMNTWSDEDEENLQHCCGAIGAADYYTYDDKQEMEEWLKSLKERLS